MKIEIISFSSTFFEYLCSFICFDSDKLMALMKRYFIGATESGEPIFWHINAEHKITNGHIITMSGDTGKVYGNSWYHQDGWATCLFGEHLLEAFPDRTVALVKDEMTAAIMNCFPTPYVWLATGKDDVTFSDLLPLECRTVIVFPDKGEYDKWNGLLQAIPNFRFHVSDVMEKSQGDYRNIAQVTLSQQPLCPTDEEVALMRMEKVNPNIALLVKAFDLEVVSVSHGDAMPLETTNKLREPFESSVQSKAKANLQKFLSAQERLWHGRNKECHSCSLSHEGINGTYCGKLQRYVEYGKGNCGR